MRLLKNGGEIPLSSKESFLMRYFLSNRNKVLTKEQIYSSIWGNSVVDDNTIMVHIHRLRAKIEDDPNQPNYLKTVRGVGHGVGQIFFNSSRIITKHGIKKNGSLLYTFVPMHEVVERHYEQQFAKAELSAARQNAKIRAEKLGAAFTLADGELSA